MDIKINNVVITMPDDITSYMFESKLFKRFFFFKKLMYRVVAGTKGGIEFQHWFDNKDEANRVYNQFVNQFNKNQEEEKAFKKEMIKRRHIKELIKEVMSSMIYSNV